MDTLDRDPILELTAFLRSTEGISSKLAQEIVNAHLMTYMTMLSIFGLFFIMGIGIARSASHRSGASAFEIEKQRGLGTLIAFVSFLLCIIPLYYLAQGFLFPRLIVLRELTRMFE